MEEISLAPKFSVFIAQSIGSIGHWSKHLTSLNNLHPCYSCNGYTQKTLNDDVKYKKNPAY